MDGKANLISQNSLSTVLKIDSLKFYSINLMYQNIKYFHFAT